MGLPYGWTQSGGAGAAHQFKLKSGIAAGKGASVLDIYTERKPLYMKTLIFTLSVKAAQIMWLSRLKTSLLKRALIV
jgi:hypothetical protein